MSLLCAPLNFAKASGLNSISFLDESNRNMRSKQAFDSHELSPMYEFSVSFVEPLGSMIVGSVMLILIMILWIMPEIILSSVSV